MTADTDTFEYEGNDLEAMIGADNYYAWILSTIRPYLGKSIVEVGAGVGSFSKLLLQSKPKTLTLIEPSKMFQLLQKNISSTKTTTVTPLHGYLKTETKAVKATKPDTIVYINVMEHVKDDRAEVKQAAELLQPGGRLIIFVPAFQALYSNFDKSIDHYRRYTKADLKKILNEAGLEVEYSRYMDMVGMGPWWFSFVVMKRTTLVPFLVKTYDKLCIPVIRFFESRIPAPAGKNVLVVARRKK